MGEGEASAPQRVGIGSGFLGRGKGAAAPRPGRSRLAAAAAARSHERAVGASAQYRAELCQAAEGRGTQCLARPPGGTGSSGAQGPWSEYTAQPQLRWGLPWLLWRAGLAGAQAQELSFCTHEQSAGSAFHAICSRHPAFDGTDEHST